MNKTLPKDILLWLYWYPFRLFLRNIPSAWAYRLARIAGTAYFFFSPGKRDRVKREYDELFGKELNGMNATDTVKKAFTIFAQNEFEVLLFSSLNQGNIDDFVRYEGVENLDEALALGKGAMLLFAHFGANQMIMPAVGYKGRKMSQLSASPMVWIEKLPDKRFSTMEKRALELRWREELSLPVRHVNVFGSLKGAFEALGRNEVLGIAIDGGGGSRRVEVDFMGRKALWSTGAMDLAARTGCAVLPVFMVRSKACFHTLIIEPPLKLACGEENVRGNTRLFVERLERYVLKYPCHYLMFLALRRVMAEKGDTPFFMPEGSGK